MSEQKPVPSGEPEVKEYAGGWIRERKGTDAPVFLKIAFPIIGLSCVSYFIVYMNGEVSHSERGAIVRQFNDATQSSSGLMYAVAGMALIYVLLVVAFAIRKFHEEE